jgi:hypothetical protein
MGKARTAAFQHVRVMEVRIEKQKGLVEQIEASGQDSSEQIRRLNLLRFALAEMVIHCGQLTPSVKEAAHGNRINRLPSRLLRKRQ